ncbi:MAG: plasmid pRiA4b ORF-3 family protein [Bacteroidales bacterium]|nr:plasmid pRiA4b ORF-3 family protein [Bacteroidales bacterium]NLK81383.1 plasmid pRiA4b ORF-3 family protein [Bacteroidales bacterium]
MIFKLRIISDEVETFLRIIEIQENDTFLVLHTAIQEACGFDNSEITSFFVSNNEWEKLYEITLMDMKDDENPTLLMATTPLHEHITQVDDTLIYTFDQFSDRSLFITVTAIKEEEQGNAYPRCTHKTGTPPLMQHDNIDALFDSLQYDDNDAFDSQDFDDEEFEDYYDDDEM